MTNPGMFGKFNPQQNQQNNIFRDLAQLKKQGLTPEQVLNKMFNNNIPQEAIIALNQMKTSGLEPEVYLKNLVKDQMFGSLGLSDIIDLFM